MVDHLFGFPIAEPIPNKEAAPVADAIYNKFNFLAYMPKDSLVR